MSDKIIISKKALDELFMKINFDKIDCPGDLSKDQSERCERFHEDCEACQMNYLKTGGV